MGADAFERTLDVLKKKIGEFLHRMPVGEFWAEVITLPSGLRYLAVMARIIKFFKIKYSHLDIYLEPGEAMAFKRRSTNFIGG